MANEASPFSGSADSAEDTIYLRRLRLSAVVGYDAWGRPGKAQPVVICIQLNLDTSKTSNSDDLQFSFSYGQMCKEVTSAVDGKSFQDVASLVYELREAARVWPGKTIQCQISLPKTLLRVDGGLTGDFVLVRSSDFWDVSSRRYVIKGAKAACIIGVNAHERLEKQTVNVDLIISGEGTQYSRNRFIPFSDNQNPQDLVKSVLEVVEASSFETLEALASLIATTCLQSNTIPRITVAVEKPSALSSVEASGVRITRSKESETELPS